MMNSKEFALVEKLFVTIIQLISKEMWNNQGGNNQAWIKMINDLDESIKELRLDRAPFEITAEMVKRLREETGEGLMSCKKALVTCKGNMILAKEWLR